MSDKDLTIKGTLKHGLKIGGVPHKNFELREATTADIMEAEAMSVASKPFTFNTAMLCQQLICIGEYTGPFTLAILGKLKPIDTQIMQQKQLELDALGEAEQPD